MAFLYVTEFANLTPMQNSGYGQFGAQPPLAEQTVANAGVNVQSNAFNAKTRVVRLHSDSICAISFGTNPTAIVAGATGTMRMAAGETAYFGVPPGQAFKVAAILST